MGHRRQAVGRDVGLTAPPGLAVTTDEAIKIEV